MFYQVWLSAETREEANNVLRLLVRDKLIVGGTLVNGDSHYWWNGKQTDISDYHFIMCFTQIDKLKLLEEKYKEFTQEDVPMMSYYEVGGNSEFLSFIKKYTS